MSKFRYALAGVAALALVAPAAAAAHVTLHPDEVPAGGYSRLDVRVPNEEDNAATTKVAVQMPDGFVGASYEPVPGWSVAVKKEKLSQPIQTDDGPVSEQVSTITWTADDPSAGLQPGQFQDFGLSVAMPANGKAGDVLTFPAVQTYSNGDIVRWIEQPDGEHPAPQVTLTAEDGTTTAAATPAASDADSGDDSSNGLAIVALIVGALGLLVGGAALLRARRSTVSET
jgi:uncharacterized protein YcnI